MSAREVVAANVRARLAWLGMNGVEAGRHLGISHGSISNKLRGQTAFTIDELSALAALFGLEDPGPLYRVPEGFVGAGTVKMNWGPMRLAMVAAGPSVSRVRTTSVTLTPLVRLPRHDGLPHFPSPFVCARASNERRLRTVHDGQRPMRPACIR